MLKLLGYWKHTKDELSDLPFPSDLISVPFWINLEKEKYISKEAVIKYLDSGIPCNFYRGFSNCRLCGEILGTHEKTDFTYIWPDKFSHYIKVHNVIVPMDFIDHIENVYHNSQKDIDFNYWTEWSANVKIPH